MPDIEKKDMQVFEFERFDKRKTVFVVDDMELEVTETKGKNKDIWTLSELNNGSPIWHFKKDGNEDLIYELKLVEGDFGCELVVVGRLKNFSMPNKNRLRQTLRVRNLIFERTRSQNSQIAKTNEKNKNEGVKALPVLKKRSCIPKPKDVDLRDLLNSIFQKLDKDDEELKEKYLLRKQEQEKERAFEKARKELEKEKERQEREKEEAFEKLHQRFLQKQEAINLGKRGIAYFYNKDSGEQYFGIIVYTQDDWKLLGILLEHDRKSLFAVMHNDEKIPLEAFPINRQKNNIVKGEFKFPVVFDKTEVKVASDEKIEQVSFEVGTIYLKVKSRRGRIQPEGFNCVNNEKELPIVKKLFDPEGLEFALNEPIDLCELPGCAQSELAGHFPEDTAFFKVLVYENGEFVFSRFLPKASKQLRNTFGM